MNKSNILFYLALYACAGIFGSIFVFIWEYSTYQTYIISMIFGGSGAAVAVFNKVYEVVVEK